MHRGERREDEKTMQSRKEKTGQAMVCRKDGSDKGTTTNARAIDGGVCPLMVE